MIEEDARILRYDRCDYTSYCVLIVWTTFEDTGEFSWRFQWLIPPGQTGSCLPKWTQAGLSRGFEWLSNDLKWDVETIPKVVVFRWSYSRLGMSLLKKLRIRILRHEYYIWNQIYASVYCCDANIQKVDEIYYFLR